MGRYIASVSAVTPAQAQAAAARLLDPSQASIIVVGDSKLFIDDLRKAYPALELITNTGHHDKPWYGHIAVVVSDLKALCARIDAAGIKLSRPLKEGGKASSNTYFAYVRDPDGFEIELTEQKDGRV